MTEALNIDPHTGLKTNADQVDRALAEHESKIPLSFGFSCFGFPFRAMVVTGDTGSRLKFVGDMGPLPAVGATDGGGKANSIIETGPVRPNVRFVVSQGGRVMIVGGQILENQPTPIETVATVASAVAAAKPFIDLMRLCLRIDESFSAA